MVTVLVRAQRGSRILFDWPPPCSGPCRRAMKLSAPNQSVEALIVSTMRNRALPDIIRA